MATCICVAESLCCSLKLSQHCLLIGYTPIQSKKKFFLINPESWISHVEVTDHGLSIIWPMYVVDSIGCLAWPNNMGIPEVTTVNL